MSLNDFTGFLLLFLEISIGGAILVLMIIFFSLKMKKMILLWNVFRENRKRLESVGRDLQAAEDRLKIIERGIYRLQERQYYVSHHQARWKGVSDMVVQLRKECNALSDEHQKNGWRSAWSFDAPIHILKGHAENLFADLNLIDDSLANNGQSDQAEKVLRVVNS